jgi:hypothetical protein
MNSKPRNLHLSGNNIKSLQFFEEASHHFKKASVPLKMSSKSLKKPQISYESLHFSENVFKKPQNR